MNKNAKIVTGLIAVIVVLGGAFALLHNSNKPATSASTFNGPSVSNAVLVTKSDPSIGQYLADPSGKPLYTYGGDTQGVSNCTGSCLANWPAYTATGATSGLPSGVGTIKRNDNSQTQYTYNGMPLYFFVSDSAGKVTGNNVENFKVAKPAASTSSSTSSSNSNSSGGYNY